MRRTTALIGAAALVTMTATAAHASTLPKQVEKVMRTLSSVTPTDNRLPVVGGAPVGLPLQYGGGPVEVTNENFAIFWEPPGHESSATYKPLVERFFGDVGGSTLFNTTTQYYETQGSSNVSVQNVSHFGGAYVDTAPFPAGGITDAALQAEVQKVVALNGWPTGVGHEYFVYSGPGGETVASYCAYHSYVTINGDPTPYADEPYGGQSGCTVPASPNGDAAADSIINTTSHELWETITDPETGNGWVAPDGDEGSDQCNFQFGTQDASGGDTVMNGHEYIVQEEWSNAAGLGIIGCTMGP